ncbi:hypothetical protein CIB48_g5912 [Xylaria polymorpha]|nr:hypothetical protein CIB48_g5912 [Xylaria polymorpha]
MHHIPSSYHRIEGIFFSFTDLYTFNPAFAHWQLSCPVTTGDSSLEAGIAPPHHSLGRMSQGHLHETPGQYRNWDEAWI